MYQPLSTPACFAGAFSLGFWVGPLKVPFTSK